MAAATRPNDAEVLLLDITEAMDLRSDEHQSRPGHPPSDSVEGELRGGLAPVVPVGADRPVERAAAPAVDCPSIVSIDLGNAECTERRET